MSKLLSIEEVALLMGCSIHTIELWYRFKRNNPNNDYAKILPEYIQELPRQKRFWKEEDISNLKQFQMSLPRGRNGVMGSISQKYYHKEGKKNGKKKIVRSVGSTKNRNRKTDRVK